MPRSHVVITQEALVEEARFILATLQRDDLFDEHVQLTEAERMLESSLSLPFAAYHAFLNKFGYVRVDPLADSIEVTKGGVQVTEAPDDREFNARLARHFARDLANQTGPPLTGRTGDTVVVAATEPLAARAARATSSPIANPGSVDEVLDRRYRRIGVIGHGTIGTVYKGQHVGLGRSLAIKEARGIFHYASFLRRDEVVRRIRTAVESQARLEHPSVCQVVDQNIDREFPYFVLELARGGNLRQRLAAGKGGRLPLEYAVRIVVQIATALEYAHAEGILHLGLKPENVLFDRFGNVKLTDFGLMGVTERTDEAASTPVLVGGTSVGYLPPEWLQPGASASGTSRWLEPTGAADVYGLGILSYEILTGRLPGRRSPLPSQARPEVPAAFDDVFDRMTRDDPAERHASFGEVLEGIHEAFSPGFVFKPDTLPLWSVDPAPLAHPEVPPIEVIVEDPSEEPSVDPEEVRASSDEIHAAPNRVRKSPPLSAR